MTYLDLYLAKHLEFYKVRIDWVDYFWLHCFGEATFRPDFRGPANSCFIRLGTIAACLSVIL